jgi:release factor glutamine methyltransferase
MRIPSNKVRDIVRFAHLELDSVYTNQEVGVMIHALLEEFCGLSKIKVLTEPDLTVSESELLKIHFAIKDLKRHKPLQYILGKTDFFDLNILLSHNVLIPRPETEELVSRIIEENKGKKDLRIADLGCGSGCIAIALAKHLKSSKVFAFDISDEALKQTEINAQHNEVAIEIIKADMGKELHLNEQFDIIVSNPPYVRESEKIQMRANVIDYEPHLALFVTDENPLIFYQNIASIASKSLKNNGKIYLEINESLSVETELIFKNLNYETEVIEDLFGKCRMVFARKKSL